MHLRRCSTLQCISKALICATLQCISKLLICATMQCILKALRGATLQCISKAPRGATLQCMCIVQWIYRKVHPSNIEMCWDAELIFRKVYTSPAQVSVFMQSQLFHFAQNWQREGVGSGPFCCQFHKAFVSQHNEQTYPTSFWYIQKFMKYIFRCIMLYLLRHIMKYRFRYILRYIFTQLPHPSNVIKYIFQYILRYSDISWDIFSLSCPTLLLTRL